MKNQIEPLDWLRECAKIFGVGRDSLAREVESALLNMRSQGSSPVEAVEKWLAAN